MHPQVNQMSILPHSNRNSLSRFTQVKFLDEQYVCLQHSLFPFCRLPTRCEDKRFIVNATILEGVRRVYRVRLGKIKTSFLHHPSWEVCRSIKLHCLVHFQSKKKWIRTRENLMLFGPQAFDMLTRHQNKTGDVTNTKNGRLLRMFVVVSCLVAFLYMLISWWK